MKLLENEPQFIVGDEYSNNLDIFLSGFKHQLSTT